MPDSSIASQFQGLPLGQLICGPIVEVAKGQAELCRVYLDYLFKLAFQPAQGGGSGGGAQKANVVTFTLERLVTDGKGSSRMQPFTVTAPLLALVPVPAFTMQEATVEFTMEVKQQETSTDEKDTSASASLSASYFGVSASFSGSVTTKSSNTRASDQSAKYDIVAKAVQQPPAEGMARLTQIFASVIEPINVGGAGGGGAAAQ